MYLTDILSYAFLLIFNFSKVGCSDGDHFESLVGFCEEGYYSPKSKAVCPQGVTFGERAPKCVCVKGIYQLYMENCEVAEGFAEEVCMMLEDPSSKNKVVGIKLTKDPSWKKTAVVMNRLAGSYMEWDYIPEFSKAKLHDQTFYTINGEAFISPLSELSKKKLPQICVQKHSGKDIICLYRHRDNVELWQKEYIAEVAIKTQCPKSWKPLLKKKCFNPLTLLDSDCQLRCDKNNRELLVDGAAKMVNLHADGRALLDGNCTDPMGYFRHENSFVDRQLITYVTMDQLGRGNVSIPPPQTEGIDRVYQMLQLVKNISIKSCEHPYYKRDVLEWASRFFLYLHRATKLKTEIKLPENDFKWIESILLKCQERIKPLVLTDLQTSTDPCSVVKRAQGFCNQQKKQAGENDGECNFVRAKIAPMYADFEKKHHVPEYAWLFLDIVHMNCFEDFQDSYRMFHIMQQAYEQLFTPPIRDYWHFPIWNNKEKQSMFTIDAEENMWNTQICAESIYRYHDHKLFRLARPETPKYVYSSRPKRAPLPISSSYNVFCAKSRTDFNYPTGCSNMQKPSRKDALRTPQVHFAKN